MTATHFSAILNDKAVRRRRQADEGDDSTLICGECGRDYPLHQCEHRNAERLLLQCPGCGAELLEYTALQPIGVDGTEVPPFVEQYWAS